MKREHSGAEWPEAQGRWAKVRAFFLTLVEKCAMVDNVDGTASWFVI